jgi:excinuclease UvrABC ATPase subunit
MGPGAGEAGGQLMWQGSVEALLLVGADSPTRRALLRG